MFVDSFCGFDVFGWYGAKGINACIHIDDKYVYVYIYITCDILRIYGFKLTKGGLMWTLDSLGATSPNE